MASLVASRNGTPFAVRSGGHTPIAGASGTNGGVLIASDRLRNMELKTFEGQEVVQVGPGLRWIEVYEWLANQGLTVIGGRYATVGVGGGMNYYRSVHGWAADLIVNFELVDARGNIVQVNKKSNSKLFWALKGGSGNCGFVARFDFAVFPLIEIYGGNLLTNASGTDALVKASASYANPMHGGTLDPLSAANPTIQLVLDTRQRSSFTNLFYNASVGATPAALANFTSIPVSAASTVAGPRSFIGCMNETAAFSNDQRRLFRATSVKRSSEAVELAQRVFDTESSKLRTVVNGSVTITYQYMTQTCVDAAHANGNTIDLKPTDGPLVAILLSAAWSSASDDAYLLDFLTLLVNSIDSASKTAGLYYQYIFLNDAGKGRSPFPTYGRGRSLPVMKAIAKEYDPKSVFQQLSSGAFKL
ncbi:MAG: hypothetical protein L6R38_009101 [Xanthoria sp. 2 TBL-2021]|nr:MAG: hypothetical protein L6R38_009101 [Xanthoria sp. 2 TBL-2021]